MFLRGSVRMQTCWGKNALSSSIMVFFITDLLSSLLQLCEWTKILTASMINHLVLLKENKFVIE